ncbi:hypothetical protein D3C85_1585970 [compost metagenome]
MPAVEEQRLAFFGVAERGVAALVGEVVGLGLDDPRGQPVRAVTVADDLAQQSPGQFPGVAVEETVGQGLERAGGRIGHAGGVRGWAGGR